MPAIRLLPITVCLPFSQGKSLVAMKNSGPLLLGPLLAKATIERETGRVVRLELYV